MSTIKVFFSEESVKERRQKADKIRKTVTKIDFELRSPLLRRVVIGACIAVLAVFVTVQFASFGKTKLAKMNTNTALLQTVTRSVAAEGFIVREESVLTANAHGTVVPRVENGSKVSAGDTVAEIFPTNEAAMRLLELDAVNERIDYYEAIQNLNAGNIYENKDTYNRNISHALVELIACANENDLSALSKKVQSFSVSVAKKQIVVGELTDVSARLDALYDRRTALDDAISAGAALTADTAGYYVDKADGYESAADYTAVQSFLPDDVDRLLSASPAQVNNNVGKIISQFNWYLVCCVSAEDAAGIRTGSKINISFPGYTGGNLRMELVAMNEGADGRIALVFRCNIMNAEAAALRSGKVKLCLEEYRGFPVEKTALRTVEGKVGVYVQVGNLVKFRRIEIIYQDENMILAAEKQSDDDFLQLYDEIIKGGTDIHAGDVVD